jgi:hypothetical protein
MRRLIPRNRFAAVLVAVLMGIALPTCDCSTIPVARRLLSKGVPLYVAITFMLAAPILNPLVVFSTWFAFYQHPLMILYRVGFGLVVALVMGLLFSILDARYWVVPSSEPADALHAHRTPFRSTRVLDHVGAIVEHASEDFFDIGRYFLVGVLLSSFVQVTVPGAVLYAIGQRPMLSVFVMIAAAFLLSVCSQADAFIAQGFLSQFTAGAIVAFLVFGPMIDMKNTLMLLSTFKKRLILLLAGMVAESVFIIGAFIVPAGLMR